MLRRIGKTSSEGATTLVLKGTTNEINVTNYHSTAGVPKKIAWPYNGLIYVQANGKGCA